MYSIVNKNEINIFEKPARLIIAGSSGAGKSYFVSALIEEYRENFDHVIVIGSDLENISHLNVTRDDTFDPLNSDLSGDILIIFDDIIFNKHQMTLAAETYTRGRHKKISYIFVTQNIFLADQKYRVISLNATHVIVFRCRDLRQMQLFAKSLFARFTNTFVYKTVHQKSRQC